MFYKSLQSFLKFHNFLITFAHTLISSRGQSLEYLIFSRAKTFNQNPYFLLRKCAKTHLQQSRISKFFGGESPDPRLQGQAREGKAGEGAMGGWGNKRRWEGMGGRKGGRGNPDPPMSNTFRRA